MRFNKSLVISVYFVLVSLSGFSQTDNSNEAKPVEFTFGDNAFKQIFPFDQFFTIKFKDVPPNIISIKVKFYEYDDKKYRSTIKSSISINQSVLDSAAKTYEFSAKKFLKADKDIDVSILVKLKPGYDYFVEVNGDTSKPLTLSEKLSIKAALHGRQYT